MAVNNRESDVRVCMSMIQSVVGPLKFAWTFWWLGDKAWLEFVLLCSQVYMLGGRLSRSDIYTNT